MFEFNQYIVLVIISAIVMVSHIFDIIAKQLKIPAVLFLMGSGLALRSVSEGLGWPVFYATNYLKVFGTVGLILIVLEGALDLQIKKGNWAIVRRSLGAAVGILIGTVTLLAMFFYYWLGADLHSAVVNAIPLAVISSAIVISSTTHLAQEKKEFLTYESIFSDIIGIMFFSFVIELTGEGLRSTVDFLWKVLLTGAVSVVCSIFLAVALDKIKAQAKFFIILSFLVFIYSIGRLFELSSLLLVFIFGLMLNNWENFLPQRLQKIVAPVEFNDSRSQFKLIISESAFLIRTFFFVLFGYSIILENVWSGNVLRVALPVVLILLGFRFVYLKAIVRTNVFPEIFFAPRGLITILLFFSIPAHFLVGSFTEGEIFFVILTTSLLMMVGGFSRAESSVK